MYFSERSVAAWKEFSPLQASGIQAGAKGSARGSKDRVTKMKEINMYQQKRGEAKKEIEAAEAELQTFLNPESVPSNPHMRRGGSRRLVK